MSAEEGGFPDDKAGYLDRPGRLLDARYPLSERSDRKVTHYSREQFLARLMETAALGPQEAADRICSLERSVTPGSQSFYREFTSTYDFGRGYAVQAGVLYLQAGEGESPPIVGLAGQWTRALDETDCAWTEAYHIVNWTPTQITQLMRGQVALRLHSWDRYLLRARMQESGFQDGTTLGGVWYTAKVRSWQDTLQVGSDSGTR